MALGTVERAGLAPGEQSACSLPLADAMDQRRTPCHIDGASGFQRTNELTERDASASGRSRARRTSAPRVKNLVEETMAAARHHPVVAGVETLRRRRRDG